jgi:2-polyprenyl-3-methyl-5-hydroxy-6-metoxy-1,4-benzoquinol methylase
MARNIFKLIFQGIIDSQKMLSNNFDKLLPEKYNVDGEQDFIKCVVPKYLVKDCVICDVGGGKNPYLSPDKKKLLNARVVGLDIDIEELNRAPEGSYDETINIDITEYQGNLKTDFVICRAVLEHVKGVEKAFATMSNILKPGGLALVFVPSRNAVFARINVILPQNIKKNLLNTISHDTTDSQGFPAYYEKCTPLEFRGLAARNSLSVIEERLYFRSFYFSFFFPAHLVWRLWLLLFQLFKKEQAAETFSMVLRKKG